MKKVILGVALVAVMAGCLVAGNADNSNASTPVAGDRNGLFIG